jgi:hypothetical protein
MVATLPGLVHHLAGRHGPLVGDGEEVFAFLEQGVEMFLRSATTR